MRQLTEDIGVLRGKLSSAVGTPGQFGMPPGLPYQPLGLVSNQPSFGYAAVNVGSGHAVPMMGLPPMGMGVPWGNMQGSVFPYNHTMGGFMPAFPQPIQGGYMHFPGMPMQGNVSYSSAHLSYSAMLGSAENPPYHMPDCVSFSTQAAANNPCGVPRPNC